MKIFIIFVFVLFLPLLLLGQEKDSIPDTVNIEPDYKSPTEDLPFSMPRKIAKEGGFLKFNAPKEHPLTYIIPKADTLFADQLESIGLVVGREKFLIIHLEAGKSKILKVNHNANPEKDENGKIYYYAVYWKGQWAEGQSSPMIIIKPGS